MKIFINRLISLVLTIVESLLGLRIFLKFLGASRQADFVSWLYETTQPLLRPFEGIFPTARSEGGLILEFSAIFALIIYAMVANLLIELLAITGKTNKK